jgi:hypothetical protein
MKKLFVYAVEFKAYKIFKSGEVMTMIQEGEGIFGRIHNKVMSEYMN